MNLKILAFDTSFDACSVACCNGANKDTDFSMQSSCVAEEFVVAPCKHSLFILDFVKRVLTAQNLNLIDLDVIAFSCGPGSFTGARLAASIVQGLALAHDLPVVAISTLQVMAQGVHVEYDATHALVAVDARTQELYWGEYKFNKEYMEAVTNDQLLHPENLLISPAMLDEIATSSTTHHKTVCLGNGWDVYQLQAGFQGYRQREQLSKYRIEENCLSQFYPRARYVAQLGVFAYAQGKSVFVQDALPVYLRNDIVKVTKNAH